MSDTYVHAIHASSRRGLWTALALVGGFMVVEVIGGALSNSLSLLADAAHMVTDAAAIGLALLAMWVASRPESISRTFGFRRTEVIAALVNALALWLVAGVIFFEAARRFSQPPEVQGGLMLGVGFAGLVVNVAAALALHRSSKESLNVEGAFLHVLGDLLGSVGVVTAALLIITLGWHMADPIFGVLIGVLILFSSGRLLWKVVHVLMEGTPASLDLNSLCRRLEQVEGITGVHDIHAWTITSGYDVLSAHVTASAVRMAQPDQVLQELRDIATGEFGIAHVTIQLEQSPEGCDEGHHIAHDEHDESRETASKRNT